MIVTIMESAPSAWFSLQYNEDKVQQGVAEIESVGNIKSADFKDIWEAIVGREKNNKKTEKPSLHIAFSPGIDDNIPHEEMTKFIDAWMLQVGLGDQPYAVYYHHDIIRGHYHVVSTKLREDGKSVKANNLAYKSQDAMARLRKEFSFYIGKNRKEQKAVSRKERDKILEQKGFDPFHFNPAISNVWDQIGLIYSSVLRDFTYRSDNEFRTIMDACGLDARILPSKYEGNYLVIHYRDNKGRKTGHPRIFNNYDYQMMHSRKKEGYRPEIKRVASVIRESLSKAKSIDEFEELLKESKLTPRLFKNKNGGYQGVSFVDYHDFQVIKASELGNLGFIIRTAYETNLEDARRRLEEQEEKEIIISKDSAPPKEIETYLNPDDIKYLKRRFIGHHKVPEYISRKLPGRDIKVFDHNVMTRGDHILYALIDGEDYTVKYNPQTKECLFADGIVSVFMTRRVEFRDFPEGNILTHEEASRIEGEKSSNMGILDTLRKTFPDNSVSLHQAVTINGKEKMTVAYASIDGHKKTVIMKGNYLIAMADGFVKQDVAFKTGEVLSPKTDAVSSLTYGLFRLIKTLSNVKGSSYQPASSSSPSDGRKTIWDESLEAAEQEERETKRFRGLSH